MLPGFPPQIKLISHSECIYERRASFRRAGRRRHLLSSPRQLPGVGLDLPHRLRDALHVAPASEEHALVEPGALLAQAIVPGAAVALLPPGDPLCRVDRA